MGAQPGAAQLRAKVVHVGLLSSALASVACAGYLALTGDVPNRPALWSLLGVSVIVTALLATWGRRIPRARIMTVLHAWAVLQTLIIATGVALDGGFRPPLVAFLFIPLVASSIGFPPRDVVTHGFISSGAAARRGRVGGAPSAPGPRCSGPPRSV